MGFKSLGVLYSSPHPLTAFKIFFMAFNINIGNVSIRGHIKWIFSEIFLWSCLCRPAWSFIVCNDIKILTSIFFGMT